MSEARTYSTTVPHVRIESTRGGFDILDDNNGVKLGRADVRDGFVYYSGRRKTLHHDVSAVVAGDIDDLVRALNTGLRNGRDDSAAAIPDSLRAIAARLGFDLRVVPGSMPFEAYDAGTYNQRMNFADLDRLVGWLDLHDRAAHA